MRRPILHVACGLLMACAPPAGTVDPRANALVGVWCLRMAPATPAPPSPVQPPSACASVALVAVRQHAEPARIERVLLAEGAISMFEPSSGERVPDGTPVMVRTARGDSVAIEFASAHGDYTVYLTGVLQGDTLDGRWRSVLGRSGGAAGRFVLTRVR